MIFQLDISDFSDLFFNWDLLHAKMNNHYEHGVTRKEVSKD